MFQELPDQHTEYAFGVTVESWWPLVVLLVIAAGVLVYRWWRLR